MLRFCLTVLSVFAASALAEARACTTLPSQFAPGSAEFIAEERAQSLRTAARIAGSELVLAGKFVKGRQLDLGEIQLGLQGEFGPSDFDGPLIPRARLWFEPTQVLKGPATLPTANLFVGEDGVYCWTGPSLEKGVEAVVSANRSPNGYWYGDVTDLSVLPYVEAELRQR